MKRPILTRLWTLRAMLLVSVLFGWGAAGEVAVAAELGDAPVPRPCFIPAHPLKGTPPPPLTRPTSPRAGRPALTVGGAALPYHADHLREGTLPAAEDVFPRQFHIAVILVDFEDEEMGTAFADLRADSTRMYFERALSNMRQMYLQMSGGQVAIDWEIAPRVYRLPRPLTYYGLDDSVATREAALCRDAVQAADPDMDYSRFNTFLLFHAGPGQEADINNDSPEQIWSVFFRQMDFGYWLDAPDAEFGIRTQDTDADGDTVYVPNMVVVPESESQDGYVFGLQGVVAHEFGHRFGLPDLYDTTGPEGFIFADSQGIGAFGLMGAGIWNDDGFFPAEMCAWSKFYVGWIRPTVLRPEAAGGERLVTLDAIELARRDGAVRIPLGGDEYFLIANRLHDYDRDGVFDFHDVNGDSTFQFWIDDYENTEFDWYLPQFLTGDAEPGFDGSGLLIWHIDESIIREYLPYNMVNADARHKGVDLEEADGIQDLDKLVFAYEAFGDPRDSFWSPNAVEFTPFSVPNTDGYFGARSGIWITDVSEPGTTMTFRLRFDAGEGDGAFRAGWPVELPGRAGDFQPIVGDLDGDRVQEIAVAVTDSTGLGGVFLLDPDGSSHFPPHDQMHPLTWGRLRSEPILVILDPQHDTTPALVWVTGDTLLAMTGSGAYLTADGTRSATPAPFFRLGLDPGRIRLSAEDLDGHDKRPEILVSVPSSGASGWVNVTAVSYVPGVGTAPMALVSYEGEARLPHVMADLDTLDNGLREIVTSVRTEAGGFLGVGLLSLFPIGHQYLTSAWIYSEGDSVAFTAPVAGDLDRDGMDEIVVGDSEGYVHAFDLVVDSGDRKDKNEFPTAGAGFPPPEVSPQSGASSPRRAASALDADNEHFAELRGWPVRIGTLADDALSLGDVDGDGFLEVLAFGPGNRLVAINYNGTPVLSLPVGVPAEDRFTQPFLSPLALDLVGGTEPELLLPLPDDYTSGGRLAQTVGVAPARQCEAPGKDGAEKRDSRPQAGRQFGLQPPVPRGGCVVSPGTTFW